MLHTTTSPPTPLLTAPTELRHQIYSYILPHNLHLSFHKKTTLRTTSCVIEPDDDDPDEFIHVVGTRAAYRKWARYMQYATWGQHWRCERRALVSERRALDEERGERDRRVGVLLVCKAMYVDVRNMLAHIARFHLSGPEILDLFIPSSRDSLSHERRGAYPIHASIPGFLPHIVNLHITVKLPLSLFSAQENDTKHADATSPPGLAVTNPWTHIDSLALTFPTLRKLHVWLAYLDWSSWSLGTEWRVLAPLERLARTSDVEVVIELPREKTEDPASDGGPASCAVDRFSTRYRERRYVELRNVRQFVEERRRLTMV